MTSVFDVGKILHWPADLPVQGVGIPVNLLQRGTVF